MADLGGGGAKAFSNVVTELLHSILEAKVHNLKLKACLNQLKGALELLNPLIEDAKQLHMVLTDSKKEDINVLCYHLRQGKELILKCSKLRCYNFSKRHRHTEELIELRNTVLGFYKISSQIDTWLDTQKLFAFVQGSEKLNVLGRKDEAVCIDHSSYKELKSPTKVFGLEGPLEELERKLFCDVISVIGVCGPAGCGKTTMVRNLCRHKKIRDIFRENIFFWMVSNSPDILGILQKLWLCLLKIRGPRFASEEDAKQQLSDSLCKAPLPPTLIILDDVWSAPVIEKLVVRVANIKTIITSRTRFYLFDYTYSVQTLNEMDAMNLFCYSACIEDTAFRDTYKELVQKIVKGCKGFPLALKVIGHSLRYKMLVAWQAMAVMLKDDNKMFNAYEGILNCLSSTLAFLDNQLRDCFADLGCFPEDKKIPAASLIDIWTELYSLSEDEAYAILLKFSTRYLITLIERTRNDAVEDGIFNDLFVVQHDLLRDLAIHYRDPHINQNVRLIMNQREDGLPDGWKQITDGPFMARIVSLHTGEMSSSSWFEMGFPHAEAVILNFLANTYHLPSFLERIPNLKVLNITNHSMDPAVLCMPPKLGCLKCLKRIRLERISIRSFSATKEPFQSLKKLSMFFCEFGEVDSYSMLVFPTIFPELAELEIDYCCDLVQLPSGICEMKKLQKLKVSKCPDLIELPEKLGELSSLEVLSLHGCTSLEYLPNSICKLKKLALLDVSDCSNISEFPQQFGELSSLRKINMRSCSQMTQLPLSVRELKGLREVITDIDTASFWEGVKHFLPMMELHVVKETVNLNFLM